MFAGSSLGVHLLWKCATGEAAHSHDDYGQGETRHATVARSGAQPQLRDCGPLRDFGLGTRKGG
jgi:hypothetical protein